MSGVAPESNQAAGTVAGLLRRGAQQLADLDGGSLAADTPRLDAELLLGHVLGQSRTRLAMSSRDPVRGSDRDRYETLLARRMRGEPVAYLLARAPFLDFELQVGPDVLVPRPETEALAEWAIERLRAPGAPTSPRVLDVGTGSGALAIAVARAIHAAKVVGVDISAGALRTARRNAAALGCADRLLVERADLIPESGGPFDLVVANLPYVGLDEVGDVDPGVLRHEPHVALFAGDDGLAQVRRLAALLPKHLSPMADVGLEVGYRQTEAVRALLSAAMPRCEVRVQADLAGHPRLVLAEAPRR